MSLGYVAVEGAVTLTAAILANSIALLGFGLDSAIEGLASTIVIWRFTGERRLSFHAEQTAQRLVAITFFQPLHRPRRNPRPHRRPTPRNKLDRNRTDHLEHRRPLLGRAKQRIGSQLGSGATAGEGAQNMLCAYLAAGVLAGLTLNAVLGLWWADPAIALAVAFLAVREGRETWHGKGCCTPTPIDGALDARCQDDCCAHGDPDI